MSASDPVQLPLANTQIPLEILGFARSSAPSGTGEEGASTAGLALNEGKTGARTGKVASTPNPSQKTPLFMNHLNPKFTAPESFGQNKPSPMVQ